LALGKAAIQELYRKRARNYDFTANLYYLIGFREVNYRKKAIAQLALNPGDTVVEIGCGTGLNFSYLRDTVGDNGHIFGVDLTDAMLQQAKDRISAHGWNNIELQHGDAALYQFPTPLHGVFSSFALTLVPEYESVIANAYNALQKGGRLVILDLKKSEHLPLWMTRLGVAISKPFGVSLDLGERKPWQTLHRYFKNVKVTDCFGGFVYIAVAEK